MLDKGEMLERRYGKKFLIDAILSIKQSRS